MSAVLNKFSERFKIKNWLLIMWLMNDHEYQNEGENKED